MSRIIILGAGISGHTAALILRRKLNRSHEIIVVSPNSHYQWIPSNIWVGIGQMKPDQVKFKLEPVYRKLGIHFKQARAIAIYPEGDKSQQKQFVEIQFTSADKRDQIERLEYDYLVNATGPKLNFEATPGLKTENDSYSICTYDHAEHAWKKLQESLERMANGQKQKILIGVGHSMSTCQGAGFEYALNVAFEINKRGLQQYAEITWITNEFELGDFGMGGAFIKRGGYITSTKIFTESILSEYGIKWIKRAGIYKLEKGIAFYENLEGEKLEIVFNFAMLIPGFAGVGLKAYNKSGNEITDSIFAPNGFMRVDADYTVKSFEEWNANDWPSTYQNQDYDNIFACGIAFAPPHPISKPMKNINGTSIFPTPPRTGMPSGVMGKVVALNIADKIKSGRKEYRHKASMARMGAACIISAGYGLRHGSASTMTVFPIVPDYEKYPKWGRDLRYTVGEPGLAGHWIKLFLHYMFLYKAKAKPFWYLIPE